MKKFKQKWLVYIVITLLIGTIVSCCGYEEGKEQLLDPNNTIFGE